MHELIKEIERQLGCDMTEEGNMSARDVLGIIKDFNQQQLNDNQKEVLEWLEAYSDKDSGDYPIQTLFYMWNCIESNRLDRKVLKALRNLTRKEQFEVLAVFAQRGSEKEDAE